MVEYTLLTLIDLPVLIVIQRGSRDLQSHESNINSRLESILVAVSLTVICRKQVYQAYVPSNATSLLLLFILPLLNQSM